MFYLPFLIPSALAVLGTTCPTPGRVSKREIADTANSSMLLTYLSESAAVLGKSSIPTTQSCIWKLGVHKCLYAVLETPCVLHHSRRAEVWQEKFQSAAFYTNALR